MPTPAVEVLRTMLAYTAQDWELCHWDVCQAFIQADMEKDIYVCLCDGCGVWSGKIVKLLKSLYRRRQSGRNFHLLLMSILKEIGFEQRGAVRCLLHLVRDGRVMTLIAPRVDDLMVTGELDSVNRVFEHIRQLLD
ncbi:unnamed protein product [Discosporangium mesarthrocarpum]